MARAYKTHLLIALAYAATFPLTNVYGGGIAMLGIMLVMPFLPVAGFVGVMFVYWLGAEDFYLLGAFLAISLQAFVLLRWLFAKKSRVAS